MQEYDIITAIDVFFTANKENIDSFLAVYMYKDKCIIIGIIWA